MNQRFAVRVRGSRCARVLGALVAVAACAPDVSKKTSAPPLNRSTVGGLSLEDARAYELGATKPRNYRAAAKIYGDLCVAGCGSAAACGKYIELASRSRGVVLDGIEVARIVGAMCDRGSLLHCFLAAYAGLRPGTVLDRAKPEACAAGDADTCMLIVMSTNGDGSTAESTRADAEARACRLGVLEACISIVRYHHYVEDADVAAATTTVNAACAHGDADACEVVPGKANTPATLCDAGDYGVCDKLAERNDAGRAFVDRSSHAAQVACAGGRGELCDPERPRATSLEGAVRTLKLMTQACNHTPPDPHDRTMSVDMSNMSPEDTAKACAEVKRLTPAPCPQ